MIHDLRITNVVAHQHRKTYKVISKLFGVHQCTEKEDSSQEENTEDGQKQSVFSLKTIRQQFVKVNMNKEKLFLNKLTLDRQIKTEKTMCRKTQRPCSNGLYQRTRVGLGMFCNLSCSSH